MAAARAETQTAPGRSDIGAALSSLGEAWAPAVADHGARLEIRMPTRAAAGGLDADVVERMSAAAGQRLRYAQSVVTSTRAGPTGTSRCAFTTTGRAWRRARRRRSSRRAHAAAARSATTAARAWGCAVAPAGAGSGRRRSRRAGRRGRLLPGRAPGLARLKRPSPGMAPRSRCRRCRGSACGRARQAVPRAAGRRSARAGRGTPQVVATGGRSGRAARLVSPERSRPNVARLRPDDPGRAPGRCSAPAAVARRRAPTSSSGSSGTGTATAGRCSRAR